MAEAAIWVLLFVGFLIGLTKIMMKNDKGQMMQGDKKNFEFKKAVDV